MAFDPNRASFVQREYRFEEAEDLNVRAIYPTARQYVLNTNLTSMSVAYSLADAIFSESRKPASAYKIEVEGVFLIDTLDGGPLRYEVRSEKYGLASTVYKVVSFECDVFNKRTTFEVRG